MPATVGPVRRGVPVCFTLDPEAERLLRAMVANRKAFGLFVSELVRREADRRTARLRLVQAAQEDLA